MKKRYFIEHWEDSVWMGYLEAKEEDIEKVVDLAATVYVPKDGIEDIARYQIESEVSDEIMNLENAGQHVFLHIDEFTDDERLCLEDLNAIELEESIIESIIEKMKANAIDGEGMEWREIYRWWDGGNWRTYYLSGDLAEDVEEVTDELEGMEEIDFEKKSFGQYHLYKLKDGRRMIEYLSYWQGEGSKICIIDEEVDTIDEAIIIVEEKDRRLFPEKYMMVY